MNANTRIIGTVGKEILPSDKNDGLVVTDHPAFYDKNPDEFSYERNKKSAAYIPYGKGTHYACGAFNGGKSKEYLKLCQECEKLFKKDIKNGIMPVWQDESILNKYLLDKNPLILSVAYLYPEEKYLPYQWYETNPWRKDIKILSVDKSHPRYGGRDYLRGIAKRKVIFKKHRSFKNFKTFYLFGIPFFIWKSKR